MALKTLLNGRFLWLGLLTFLMGAGSGIAQPYLSLFLKMGGGLSNSRIGLINIAMAVSGVVSATLLGRLSDRSRDRRAFVALAAGAAALGYYLMSMTRAFYPILLIALVPVGIGRATFSQVFAYSRQKLDEDVQKAAFYNNMLRTFYSLSWVVGPGLGAAALARGGFEWLFALAAATFVMVALAALFSRPTAPKLGSGRRPGFTLDHARRVMGPVAAFILLNTGSGVALTTLPLFVTKTLGRPWSDVGLLAGIAAAFEVPFMLLAGYLALRFGTRALVRAGALLFVAYFGLLFVATSLGFLLCASIVSAAGVSALIGVGISLFQDLLPGEAGIATSLYSSTIVIGTVTAGLVFATGADLLGYRGLFGLCALLSLVASGVLVASGRDTHAEGQPGWTGAGPSVEGDHGS